MNPIRISLAVSNRLRIALALAHGAGILAWWMVQETWWMRGIGTAALVSSAWWYDVKLRRPQLTAIEADDTGYRVLWRGTWQPAEVLEALITSQLTVINFRSQGRRLDAILLPDNVEAEAYRRLRVWLRWGKIKSDTEPA